VSDLAEALRELIRNEVEREVARQLADTQHRPDQSPFITIAEAAVLLRVPRGTVDNWTSSGRLNRHRVGRKVLLLRDEVLRLVEPPSR
jgi:excisionase family DNA binding protein